MEIVVKNSASELGLAAGIDAADLIRKAIVKNGVANIILATGASQFETLKQLVKEDLDWNKVTMFHLDEYIGLAESHPASFRKYLKERFLAYVPDLKSVHLVNGEAEPLNECRRLGQLISEHPIDVALVGIGENGHLAFNDPPADFDTEEPYILVNLDAECRQQQAGEGWFSSLEEVPDQAISMSVQQILKSKSIICSVPDKRKAKAVKNCLQETVSNQFPSTILRLHEDCTLYLDSESAGLISDNEQ